MCCQVARSCSGPQGQPLKGCREQRPTTSLTHCCYLVLTDQTPSGASGLHLRRAAKLGAKPPKPRATRSSAARFPPFSHKEQQLLTWSCLLLSGL